jgi:Tfp pilus assembly protein PilN
VSQVNLLPPDILQRQRVRQSTYAVLFAGGVVVALVVVFFVLQSTRLASVNHDIANQNQTNSALQAKNGQLQQYANLQTEAQRKEGVLTAAFAYETSFSSMMQNISQVIPSSAYLTSLTFSVTPPAPAAVGAPPASSSPLVGSMKASGRAMDLQSLSNWLTRLEGVKGWKNAWFTSATRDPTTGLWTFQSGLDLTKDVLTARGQKAVG